MHGDTKSSHSFYRQWCTKIYCSFQACIRTSVWIGETLHESLSSLMVLNESPMSRVTTEIFILHKKDTERTNEVIGVDN